MMPRTFSQLIQSWLKSVKYFLIYPLYNLGHWTSEKLGGAANLTQEAMEKSSSVCFWFQLEVRDTLGLA